jgi:hypothetical protein
MGEVVFRGKLASQSETGPFSAAATRPRMQGAGNYTDRAIKRVPLALLLITGLVAVHLALPGGLGLIGPHLGHLLSSRSDSAPQGRSDSGSVGRTLAATSSAEPAAPSRTPGATRPKMALNYRGPIVVQPRAKHSGTMIMLRE